MIRTPPNGILFTHNLLKIISNIEINSAETCHASSISKTSSDCNTFNFPGLRTNLTIENDAVICGFENELTPKENIR